ncbi:hypothetical protein VP424E501_P0186 [Vibrio phage 424E50-1]|nr:hypothetical protein VP424E501_P0186 [Vibrio phage 424E50-1]
MELSEKELALLKDVGTQLQKLIDATCSGNVGMAFDRESAKRMVNIDRKLRGIHKEFKDVR